MNSLVLRLLTASAVTTLVGLGPARAADYFLHQNQASGWNWGTTATGNLNSWYDARTGGAIITAMDSAGTYYTNGFEVRSPAVSGDATFGGTLLVLENGSNLSLKMSNSGARAIVGHLETQGTSSVSASDAGHYHSLSVADFDQAGTTTFTAVAGRSFNLTFTDIDGSGTLVFAGGATTSFYNLNFTDATGFSGGINLTGGTLTFAASLTTAGSLSLTTGSVVQLTQSVTVSALSIGGANLSSGTYSYTELNSLYDAYFADGAYTGSITVSAVPEPAHAALLFSAAALGLCACRRRRA